MTHPYRSEPSRESAARLLARMGFSLTVVFAAAVISAAVPLRLLDPGWQLRVIEALINNGPIAVVSLILIHSAALVDPGCRRLVKQRDRIASMAAVAALGYLLLIPLQGFAAFRGVQTSKLDQARQLRRSSTRIAEIRTAVQQAGSTSELQDRLRRLSGRPLLSLDQNRSLESQRSQILASLNVTEQTLRQRLGQLPKDRVWLLIQESLRVMISALAYTAAFASGARWSPESRTLFDAVLTWFNRSSERLTATLRRRKASTLTDQDYLSKLAQNEHSARDPHG